MSESYTIFDFVLAPDDKVKVEYNGPDPFRIYGKLSKMLQIIYHGRGKNVFEKQFKWDITSDPREFFFNFLFGDSKFDKFTSFEIKIKALGLQPSDPNSPKGKIYIEIKPEITTTYKFKTIFDKILGMPFVWMYHKAIYSSVRRRYIQILKEQTLELARQIREEYGIPHEMPELTGASRKID